MTWLFIVKSMVEVLNFLLPEVTLLICTYETSVIQTNYLYWALIINGVPHHLTCLRYFFCLFLLTQISGGMGVLGVGNFGPLLRGDLASMRSFKSCRCNALSSISTKTWLNCCCQICKTEKKIESNKISIKYSLLFRWMINCNLHINQCQWSRNQSWRASFMWRMLIVVVL